MLFYVDTGEKIEIKKRQRLSFRPESWNVPYRNHQACCEKLWFVRTLYPNLPQMGQKFYQGMSGAIPWLHARFHEFQTSFRFTRILKPCYSMLAAKRQCQGVGHSLSFLACDLSLQPRTNIWFCNPFLWTGACACSSILNYAHKYLENLVNV